MGPAVEGKGLLLGPPVRLRPLEREDLLCYVELPSDPEIGLLYGMPGVPESLSELQRRCDAGEFEMTGRHLLLGVGADGVLIGGVELKNSENLPSRTATFGICIGDRAYLDRGYGTQATALFLDHAFGVLGYHKINPDLFAYNARARATYAKLGFVVEGRRRENHRSRGRFWGEVLMGITADEWWAEHGRPTEPSTERRQR